MKKIFFTTFMLGALAFGATAQRNCAAHDVLQHQLQADPTLADRMEEIEHQTAAFTANNNGERVVVTIPVVVHVLYNTTAQNISDAQIASQLTVLNNDFRKLNADAALTPSVFTAADCEVQFCMAQRTPTGAATTGINRISSTRTTDWGTNDAVKLPAQGGVAPWDATKYLNIWVCSIGGGILGYAQFPGGSTSTDGVVIDYRYFGTTGTATAPFNKGRTATHEVGHWLNLRHIWGDANCGSDLVSDTPTHNTANYGCPTQPHLSTCTGTPREMTMNYMDYSDDACMYMFSAGQKTRMQALFATGGARVGLTTSQGCQPPVAGTCAAPTGLAATSITTTSATVGWSAVSGATSYNLQYKTSAATTWTTVSVTTTSSNLTGLTAGTVYNFQVAAVCTTGTTAYTASTFTTTSTTTTCTDTYESNNTSATAKTIAVNTNITATIGTSTDKDYFKFTTTATTGYKVKIDLTNLPADYDVKLYRGTTLVGTSQNTGTVVEQIKYNYTAAATYTVYVYGYNSATSASCYTLRASVQSANWRVGEGTEEEVVLDVVSEKELDFTIAPNPASDVVNLDINTVRDENVNVMVYDLTGRQVFAQQQFIAKGNSQASINVSSFGKGMYYVRIENGTTFSVKKLLVE